jgi:UPF0716 protein FxsA
MWILLAILAMPLVEIAGFVVVGSYLGVAGTLLAVMASVVLGVIILRRAGWRAIESLRGTVSSKTLPTIAALDNAYLMLAGLLLILPGFVSDIIALLILLPPVRDWLVERTLDHLSRRVVIHRTGGTSVIEGEFHEIDPKRQ